MLSTSAYAGDNTVQLELGNPPPDWTPGDQIVIAPSGWDPTESEIRNITAYDSQTGTVTLSDPLDYDHLVQDFLDASDIAGSDGSQWWGDGGSIKPEVGLLTRSIVIQGGEDTTQPLEEHHYGCRILAGSYTSTSSNTYSGLLKMDSVEVRHCGQGGYFSPRDPRYSIAFRNGFDSSGGSFIRRCSVHHGYNTAIGIHTSNGVEVSDNVIWRTTDSSVKIGGSGNTVTGNLAMLTSTVQPNQPSDNHAVDFPATFDVDRGNVLRDNAAGGSTRIGFRVDGDSCLQDGTPPTHDQVL